MRFPKTINTARIEFTDIAGLPDKSFINKLYRFYAKIFGAAAERAKFERKIVEAKNLYIVLAAFEHEIVGFKIGYELEPRVFYSWAGGVDAEFRGRGIAAALMERQHAWCVQQNYVKIRTKTQNRFKPMLILNLKHGFDIIDVYKNKDGEAKILLEKDLNENFKK